MYLYKMKAKPPSKEDLLHLCKEFIDKKAAIIKNAQKLAKEAAENETKSTAGDKHDTARAMAHLEQEKLAKQMQEIQQLAKILQKINPSSIHESIQFGSIVHTNSGNFFLSVGLGKIEHELEEYYTISTQSPLSKALIGKKKYDNFTFNGRKYSIKRVR
jgi:transcription elongation GreA/GreB family factor